MSNRAKERTSRRSPDLLEPPPVNAFLNERLLGKGRVVTWDNGDGQKVEGILTLPPEGVAKAPYKMVLYPHGGPHGRSVLGFDFTVQIFAAAGYAVFQPNYRGSAGYGQKWIDADRGDFGGGDMRDILTGIDYLVKEKIVDPERQFVYGVSYGGFMTCWLVGHTKQFRAAVAQNAVTDLGVMWGLSDLQSWTEWEFGGKPWEVPDKMREHSPLTYADQVQTPTLILHSRRRSALSAADGQDVLSGAAVAPCAGADGHLSGGGARDPTAEASGRCVAAHADVVREVRQKVAACGLAFASSGMTRTPSRKRRSAPTSRRTDRPAQLGGFPCSHRPESAR